VAREVFEETGIRVDAIEYHSSQPWPFPASLMLGFTAHALTHTIDLRDDELEDARWFTRTEVAAGVPLLPPSQSISFSLIEHWFDAGGERSDGAPSGGVPRGGHPPLRQIVGVTSWPPSR
jgi:NAD+ diphosphatase